MCWVSIFKSIKKINCCSSAKKEKKNCSPSPSASYSLDSSSAICIIYEQNSIHSLSTDFCSYLGFGYIFKLVSTLLCARIARGRERELYFPADDASPLEDELSLPTSTCVESRGLLLCQPLLSALYANTHFSINLVVRSEAFDRALASCKVIYLEFIWPLRSPGGMTPLIANLHSVSTAFKGTLEATLCGCIHSGCWRGFSGVTLSHDGTAECWVINNKD